MSSPVQRQRDEKFVVRLPRGMRQLIALKARNNSRSMNAEIIHRLDTTTELEAALERAHKVIDQLLAVGLGAEQPGAGT